MGLDGGSKGGDWMADRGGGAAPGIRKPPWFGAEGNPF